MSDKPAEPSANPNSQEIWNREGALAQRDGLGWREVALGPIYERIIQLLPARCHVVDVGGGIGALAGAILASGGERTVEVWDHSVEAVRHCWEKDLTARVVDLNERLPDLASDGRPIVVVGTELLEHLTQDTRHRLLMLAGANGLGFFSVPNYCLGPEEEKQHTLKYTALSFKQELEAYFKPVRVECELMGHRMLGICGFKRAFSMSVCFPARDEADDIEKTLRSFRGVADQMVIGIDPRSADATEEIARRYAEEVFILGDPEAREMAGAGEEDKVPEGGFHFSHARNQCMDRCTGNWIFMTEAHEYLLSGQDILLVLDHIMPPEAKFAFVTRTGIGQRWAFPWLSRNLPELRYRRSTHNILTYPPGTCCVRLPKIMTRHERSRENAVARAKQRTHQNRRTLLEDWVIRGNATSLYYLASELRGVDPTKSVARLEQFLQIPNKNGAMRYQARLILAREHSLAGRKDQAREVLLGCATDDWTRVEHWRWLGDLAFDAGSLEQALQFYRYAATCIEQPPWTMWWIDDMDYSYMPAQRLAMCYAALGRAEEALHWARRYVELLPEDAPDAAREEGLANVASIESALAESCVLQQSSTQDACEVGLITHEGEPECRSQTRWPSKEALSP